MTCPYCHREFPYDNGKLDRDISVMGQRLHSIDLRLAEIKALGPRGWTRATGAERQRLIVEKERLKLKLSELEAVRKACDQQISHFEYEEFKNQVRERFGEEEYQKILSSVKEELQAYKISGLMRHEYTRASGRANVTSINKL